MPQPQRLLLLALAALAFAGCAAGSRARAEGGLLFGITAPTDYEGAERNAGLLGTALGATFGAPVEVRLFDRYEQLVAAIDEGDVDIAWLPPLSYVEARESNRLVPLRRATHGGAATYRAVLVARSDRKLGSVEALRGSRIAWVSEGSTSGYLWPRAMLLGKGVDPKTFFLEQSFLGNHEAVCGAIYDGTVDVGAVFTDEASLPRGEISACSALLGGQPGAFSIVVASEPMPSEVVAAREGLPVALATKAAAALDALPKQPGGAAIMAELFGADGFVAGTADDFVALEQARKLLEAESAAQ